MRLLITGSAGFVGGSVGRYAAAQGHTVLGVARRSQPDRDWPGSHHALDVTQADLTPIILEFRPDAIFHAAGSASVGGSVTAPLDDFRASVISWANMLDAVRRSGTTPVVIFPSSAAVYGNPKTLPIREDAAIAPISPYGFHKAACELLAREYAKCFGLKIIVSRIFSLLGPAQRRLLVWELYEQAVGPDPVVWLQGTGNETRDYLHITDFARAVLELKTAFSNATNQVGLWVVNVASGNAETTQSVAERIVAATHLKKEVRARGIVRSGDPLHWKADVRQISSLLGVWRPVLIGQAVDLCVSEWRNSRLV